MNFNLRRRPNFSILVLTLLCLVFIFGGLYFIFFSKAEVASTLKTPAISTPTDGSILIEKRPRISWATVGGANRYKIQLFQDNILLREKTLETNYYVLDFDLADRGNYYWRVQALTATVAYGNNSATTAYAAKRRTVPIVSPTTMTVTNQSAYTPYWNFSIDYSRAANFIMPDPSVRLTGAYVPGGAADFTNFESMTNKKHQVAVKFKSFYWDTSFPTSQAQSYYDKGSHYLLTWEPWNTGQGVAQPQFSNNAIATNQVFTNAYGTQIRFDDYLTKWAQEIKAYKKPVYLRFAHEMNGNWYPWGNANGNTPTSYVAMWRHVHEVFDRNGVKNVRWVWNVNNDPAGTIASYYPGNNYVDIVSVDGYNWGTTQTWSRWTDFATVFNQVYVTLANLTDKDIWIVETATKEAGGSKAGWITNGYLYAKNSYPRIKGIFWFNQVDWAVNTSQSALDAYKGAVSSF